MLFRQTKTRKYRYTPRFYKEEGEDESKHEPRIKFRRNIASRKKKRSYVGLLLLLILIIFLMQYLNKEKIIDPEDVKFDDIETVK